MRIYFFFLNNFCDKFENFFFLLTLRLLVEQNCIVLQANNKQVNGEVESNSNNWRALIKRARQSESHKAKLLIFAADERSARNRASVRIIDN